MIVVAVIAVAMTEEFPVSGNNYLDKLEKINEQYLAKSERELEKGWKRRLRGIGKGTPSSEEETTDGEGDDDLFDFDFGGASESESDSDNEGEGENEENRSSRSHPYRNEPRTDYEKIRHEELVSYGNNSSESSLDSTEEKIKQDRMIYEPKNNYQRESGETMRFPGDEPTEEAIHPERDKNPDELFRPVFDKQITPWNGYAGEADMNACDNLQVLAKTLTDFTRQSLQMIYEIQEIIKNLVVKRREQPDMAIRHKDPGDTEAEEGEKKLIWGRETREWGREEKRNPFCSDAEFGLVGWLSGFAPENFELENPENIHVPVYTEMDIIHCSLLDDDNEISATVSVTVRILVECYHTPIYYRYYGHDSNVENNRTSESQYRERELTFEMEYRFTGSCPTLTIWTGRMYGNYYADQRLTIASFPIHYKASKNWDTIKQVSDLYWNFISRVDFTDNASASTASSTTVGAKTKAAAVTALL